MSKHQIKRVDVPSRTVEQLQNDGWRFVDSQYEYLIRGSLNMICSELERNYWNCNQKQMDTPFENNGAPDFVTDYLTIRAYNWDGNYLPNLDTDLIKVFWYKHSNRGVMAMVKGDAIVGETLAIALNNAIESINQHFADKKGDF
jgi:hypothetical protein